MSRDLGKMRIYKILKDDSVYNEVFSKRVAILEMYQSDLLGGSIKRSLNRCISLTKQCRLVAEDIKESWTRLEKIFPTGTEQTIDQLIAFQLKAASQSNNFNVKIPKQLLDAALVSQKEDYVIARQIILEAKQTKKTVKDIIDNRFPDNSSTEYYWMEQITAALELNYTAYTTGIDAGKSLIEIAQLFRGLFYMGIVDYQGSELDEEQLGNDLKDFIVEAMGIFAPQYASLLSLAKMVNKTVDVIMNLHSAQLPSIIKEAQKLELFLHKYQESLNSWKPTAKFLITRIDSLGKGLKQYQVTKRA